MVLVYERMNSGRVRILLGVAAVVAAMLVWKWIAGWGLVTIDADGQSLANVIRSIERQGGVAIATNLDPETTVSMAVYKVPVAEAVDYLAARTDARWSVAYVAGSGKEDVRAGVDALVAEERSEEFVVYSYPTWGMGMESETIPDPRAVAWSVSRSDDAVLASYLDQAAQKTGVTTVLPVAWNPAVAGTPTGGAAGKAITKLVKAEGGRVEEVFLLRISNRDRGGNPDSGGGNRQQAAAGGGGRPERGPGDQQQPPRERPEPNPEWADERVQAQIALLPEVERVAATEAYESVRDFFRRVRDLPEDQQRAAMEEHFNNPAVQDRMEERRAIRDEKQGPEKRADRYRRYVERKAAAKAAPES
jgi:hypothetical protein